MPKPRKPAPKKASAKKASSLIRPGAQRVEVFNSGLEVWLYDDASREEIRSKGLWRGLIDGGSTGGLLVGYSLWQDDGLCIDVVVGPALTERERAVARWLEPQHAFLRLPSGDLAVESNDACRVADDDDRSDKGGRVAVPPGNYRVTLYRIDYEALARESLKWTGAQEVVVLTPGGTKKDDVAGLLPFVEPRDLAWVGKIEIAGRTARGLVWFDDYWDTFFANIDSAAAAKLGLKPGSYLRTTVPAVGMELVTVFASSWEEGAKLKAPAGPRPPEFGFGAITTPQRWEAREALFCRRVKTTKAIEDAQKTLWLEATFEAFEAEPATIARRDATGALLDSGKRVFVPATLADKDYFDGDDYALSTKLDGRVEGIAFDETIGLPAAVARLDAGFAELGFTPLGDFAFDVPTSDEPREFSVRAWTGAPDCFGAAWASVDSFEVFLFSRVDGRWVLTGTLDEDDALTVTRARPRISMVGVEDAPLREIVDAHRKHLGRVEGNPDPVPVSLRDLVVLYDDYLAAAID